MKDHIPSKLTATKQSHPWINRDLNRLTRRKKRAHKKAKSTNTRRDLKRYHHLKAKSQREIRQAHDTYLQDIISGDMKGNSKRFWDYIKHKKQDSNGVAPLKNNDGLLYSDTDTKADILNRQFHSVYTKEDMTNIPNKGRSPHPTMKDITVDTRGVHKLLKGLDPNKATGPDTVPTRFLREFADEIAPTLTTIFQKSLDSGKIPEDWREASIVPIFKKGDRHQAANYRPVSLTSVSCKVLEHIVHIVHSQIMDHYDLNNILTDKQHGFRSRRSCESQLIITIDALAKSLAEGEQVDVILLDFSKAFDKVPHHRLLQKLDYYGVRDNTWKWVRDFLALRTQRVTLDGCTSSCADVISGVPQGTVMGLFCSLRS